MLPVDCKSIISVLKQVPSSVELSPILKSEVSINFDSFQALFRNITHKDYYSSTKFI